MIQVPNWLLANIEEHFEELQMLWELRRSAVADPDYDLAGLVELDERIEAHVDGLVLSEQHSRAFLLENLGGSESSVFAAAYVLLRLRDDQCAQQVINALLTAEEHPIVAAVRDALSLGPNEFTRRPLTALLDSSNRKAAVAAAYALAFHGKLMPSHPALGRLLTDADATVCHVAWQVVSLLGE